MTTEEADAAYWQGRNVGILVGAARATADAEEERLALVARAERAEAAMARFQHGCEDALLRAGSERWVRDTVRHLQMHVAGTINYEESA